MSGRHYSTRLPQWGILAYLKTKSTATDGIDTFCSSKTDHDSCDCTRASFLRDKGCELYPNRHLPAVGLAGALRVSSARRLYARADGGVLRQALCEHLPVCERDQADYQQKHPGSDA